ncbi:MAG: HNH endonuclease [Candidatus Aminicenantes bacterium]|nr:HNH endonuclease [Candidatus Aminicenantes bacterium]
MYRYRELAGERRFRCEKCGKLKQVKYVPVSNFCRRCAAKKVAEEKLCNPELPIELADNLIVTKAVEKRIIKKARREILPGRSEKIGEAIGVLSILVIFPAVYFIAKAISNDPIFYIWFSVACWSQIIWMRLVDRRLAKPRKDRADKIARRIVELAEIRKAELDEAKRFYLSSEWKALRRQVIKEEGRVCARCGKNIKDDVDLTVDHKLPRSKYHHLDLNRENLRVFCRSCNSAKGAKE